jgi:hypothetical protein
MQITILNKFILPPVKVIDQINLFDYQTCCLMDQTVLLRVDVSYHDRLESS